MALAPRIRPHALLGIALLALALLASGFISTATSRAAAPGVVSDLSWGLSQADKNTESAAMADAGVQYVRLGLGWHDMEPSKGTYSSWNLQDEDAAVQAARASGAKVILDVLETPQWASGSTNRYAAPQNPQDLADFMHFIANRYKGQVAGYEIWNEENISRFWPSGPNAAAYTALLKAAYPAIKSADPSAQVIFGGTSTNDYSYIQAAYAAGAKGYFDVMAVHPYTCASPDSVSYNGSRISQYSYLGYREVHNTMLANGDDKPLWFTEFGWSTATGQSCTVDQQTQANYLTEAYALAAQDPYVQVALWYNFRQDYWVADNSDWDGGFGLLNKDFSPKPAYYAFKSVATGSGTSSGGGTTTTPPTTTTTPPPTTTTPPPTTTTPPPTTTPTGGKKKRKTARAASVKRRR